MYFPFFRGKQYELYLLREIPQLLPERKSLIVPVIEPVRKKLNVLQTAISSLIQGNMKFVLITNPTVGEWSQVATKDETPKHICDEKQMKEVLKDSTTHYFGFIITGETTIKDLDEFFIKFPNDRLCFIHHHSFNDKEYLVGKMKESVNTYNIFIEDKTSRGYRKRFNEFSSIIVRDGFEGQDKNADYPDDDYFSDLHVTYKESQYFGFGDYLTIGDSFNAHQGFEWVSTT